MKAERFFPLSFLRKQESKTLLGYTLDSRLRGNDILTSVADSGPPSIRGYTAELPFVVSLSNHERPFDRPALSEAEGLRANGKRELRVITRWVSILNLESRIRGLRLRLTVSASEGTIWSGRRCSCGNTQGAPSNERG